jgi:hypothetical protein
MRLPVDFDFTSRVWGQLEEVLRADLETAVEKLCHPELDSTSTALLRGRVLYIKEFLLGVEAAARERLR